MPQLDLSYYISQFFWLCFGFLSLYTIVSFGLSKFLNYIFSRRLDYISKNIELSSALLNDAKLLDSFYKENLKNVEDEMYNMVKTLCNDISKEKYIAIAKKKQELHNFHLDLILDIKNEMKSYIHNLHSECFLLINQLLKKMN